MIEINQVRENLETWLKAFNNKDIDSLFTLYDPESLYANAGAPMRRGIKEIKPGYEKMFASIKGTLLFQEEYAFQDGRLAFLVGKYFFQPLEGQQPSDNDAGRVVLVYRKSENGEWLLLFDMDNSPPDCTPADFS